MALVMSRTSETWTTLGRLDILQKQSLLRMLPTIEATNYFAGSMQMPK